MALEPSAAEIKLAQVESDLFLYRTRLAEAKAANHTSMLCALRSTIAGLDAEYSRIGKALRGGGLIEAG